MKVQMREHFKKWWILVVVATLALSLTSCGKKRSRLMSGELSCEESDLGVFSMTTVPYGTNQFQVIIYIDDLYYDTDLTISLYDVQNFRYFLGDVGPNIGGEFISEPLNNSMLSMIDTVQITPRGQGSGTYESSAASAECYFY